AQPSDTAISTPLNSAYVGVARKNGGASQQAKSRSTQSIFRVPREPVTQWPRERRGKVGETYACQKINLRCRSPPFCIQWNCGAGARRRRVARSACKEKAHYRPGS